MQRFSDNFDWGIASSAYQIEGGWNADGKGPSIWDSFCKTGNIAGGGCGEICCDHYHRWKEDVKLIAGLGVKSYRLSTAWSRVLPEGTGQVNEKGLDFYDRLIDELLESGVQPIVNLHHYDLPLRLLERGGWQQRATADAYAEYANIMFDRLGDRVSRWITMNDVRGTLLGGYVTGQRAPGYSGMLREAVAGWHNMNLAAAQAIENWHMRNKQGSEIGGVMGLAPIYPADGNPASAVLAEQVSLLYNHMFLSPLVLGTYPQEGLSLLERNNLLPHIADRDLALLAANRADFIGVSYYTPMRVRPATPGVETLLPGVDNLRGEPRTESGWEIYPQGIYDLLRELDRRYPKVPIYVGETGGAFGDVPNVDDYVQDDDRIDFLRTHISEIHRAMLDGVDVRGIHLWTLLDNFEWQQGFTKRFGLIRVDHNTGKRTPKKSYSWYRDLIATDAGIIKG